MKFESYSILGKEEIVLLSNEENKIEKNAKIDTGSYSSRISFDIAKELKLPITNKKKVWSSLGEEERIFVEIQININGVEIKTEVGVTDMSMLKHEVIIGRKDIEMVDGVVDIKKEKTKNDELISLLNNDIDIILDESLSILKSDNKENKNNNKIIKFSGL